MATFKICVFKHQKRQDGKYPVSIRVTWKKSSAYIKTEYYVTDKQTRDKTMQVIDKTGQTKNKHLFELKDPYIINDLSKRIKAYEDLKSHRLGGAIGNYTAKDLVEYFQKSTQTNDPRIDFLSFSRSFCEGLKKDGRESTVSRMNAAINALEDFTGSRLPVSEVTAKLLENFAAYLKAPHTITRKDQFGKSRTHTKKGISDISLSGYMTDIRTLFNAARDYFNDEDKGEIRISHYPFSKYKIDRDYAPKPRNLVIEQNRKIRDLKDEDLKTDRAILGRDMYLLSFYLVGINLRDMYQMPATALQDGRLNYNRQKTKGERKDEAFISIRIEPEVWPLLYKYKAKEGVYLFRFKSQYVDPANFVRAVNKGLEVVNRICSFDHITSYYARHSWASIARNDCNISKDDINLCLNHVDQEMKKTTDKYIAKDWSKIDKANRLVLDKLAGIDTLL